MWIERVNKKDLVNKRERILTERIRRKDERSEIMKKPREKEQIWMIERIKRRETEKEIQSLL